MTETTNSTDALADFKEYVSAQFEITRLKVVQGTADLASQITLIIVATLLALITFSIFTVAAGLWIGSLLNNPAMGFLLLAAVYLIALGVIMAFKERLILSPVKNRIINAILNRRK